MLTIHGFLVISGGAFVGYQAYAKKKVEFDKQKSELFAAYDESEQVRQEMNPTKTGEILAEQLSAYKEMNMKNELYYKNRPEIDSTNPAVIKVLNEIEQEKQLINNIEKDLAAKIKSEEQILKEFEQGRAALRK